jgi:hypothetical protein
MPVFRYDTKLKQMVQISEKSYRNKGSVIERPFCEQVMEGYRKVEAAGGRINGRAEGIKRIWNQ